MDRDGECGHTDLSDALSWSPVLKLIWSHSFPSPTSNFLKDRAPSVGSGLFSEVLLGIELALVFVEISAKLEILFDCKENSLFEEVFLGLWTVGCATISIIDLVDVEQRDVGCRPTA